LKKMSNIFFYKRHKKVLSMVDYNGR